MSAQPPWNVQQSAGAPPAPAGWGSPHGGPTAPPAAPGGVPGPGGYGPGPGGLGPAPGGHGPTPGGFGPPPGYGGPSHDGFEAPPGYPAQPGRRRRTGLIVGVVALLVVVLGGGAVLALQFIRGSADALVAHVPADAIAYGHLNLDPSASNKLGIAALIDRVNEAAGEELVSIDGVLADLETDSDGIVFATDIDPWLGDQIGIYAQAFPVTDPQTSQTTAPSFAAVVAIDDAAAAATFVQDQGTISTWDAGERRQGWLVEGSLDSPEAVVVAIDADRLYVGTPDAVRAGLDATDGLGGAEGYATAIGSLPDRVLTIWVDVAAAVEGAAASGQMVLDSADLPDAVAMSVSFAQGSVDITTVVTGSDDAALLSEDRIARSDLAALPAGGILYGLLPDLGAQLPRLLEAADDDARADAELFGETLSDADLPSAQADAQLQQQFGTSVAELATWMGDLTVAMGYDPTQASDNAGLQLHLAVADEQAASAILDTALADIPPEEGLTIEPGSARAGDAVVQVADGRWSVTAGALGGVGTLAEDPTYTAAVDGLDGEPVMYVDIRRLVPAIAAFALSGDDPDAQRAADIAAAFDSLVATVETDGAVTRSVLRVAYGQPLQTIVGRQTHPPDIDLGPLGTVAALINGQGAAMDLGDLEDGLDDLGDVGAAELPAVSVEPVVPDGGDGPDDRPRGTLEPSTSGQ